MVFNSLLGVVEISERRSVKDFFSTIANPFRSIKQGLDVYHLGQGSILVPGFAGHKLSFILYANIDYIR